MLSKTHVENIERTADAVDRIADVLEIKEIKERLAVVLTTVAKAEAAGANKVLVDALKDVIWLSDKLRALELKIWNHALVGESSILQGAIDELEKAND